MNESYAEAGVKREKTMMSYVAKGGIIFAIIFLFFIGTQLLGMIGTFLASALLVVSIYLFPRFNVEYEYIYCDGQLDFDRITGNAKRKTILRIDFDKVEMIAPINSHALDNFKHMKLVTKDFTSLKPDIKAFVIICRGERDNLKILFEPSEKMLACMKQKSPRKISEV